MTEPLRITDKSSPFMVSIRKFMKMHDITYRELAEEMDFSPSYISAMMCGMRDLNPRMFAGMLAHFEKVNQIYRQQHEDYCKWYNVLRLQLNDHVHDPTAIDSIIATNTKKKRYRNIRADTI